MTRAGRRLGPWGVLPDGVHERLRSALAPRHAEPMRATPGTPRGDDADWIYEPHYEGRRCIAVRDGATLRFLEDGGRPMAGLERIAAVLRESPSFHFVVDGTIVRLDGSSEPDAALPWRERVAKSREQEAHYYVFDLLQLEGRDATSLRLVDRKTLLRAALRFEPPVHYVAHRTAVGQLVHETARREGWSGVVAKRGDSHYVGGPSRDWLTWRPPQRGDFLLAGLLDEERVRVVLAAPTSRGPAFAGLVELPEAEREERGGLVALARSSSPLVGGELPGAPPVRWLEPERVCTVEFADWPAGGTLVEPVFVAWQRQPGAKQRLVRGTR